MGEVWGIEGRRFREEGYVWVGREVDGYNSCLFVL